MRPKQRPEFITDTSAHTVDWDGFIPIVDTVISACTITGQKGSLAGETVKAGIPIFGHCTAITLTSGAVMGNRE